MKNKLITFGLICALGMTAAGCGKKDDATDLFETTTVSSDVSNDSATTNEVSDLVDNPDEEIDKDVARRMEKAENLDDLSGIWIMDDAGSGADFEVHFGYSYEYIGSSIKYAATIVGDSILINSYDDNSYYVFFSGDLEENESSDGIRHFCSGRNREMENVSIDEMVCKRDVLNLDFANGVLSFKTDGETEIRLVRLTDKLGENVYGYDIEDENLKKVSDSLSYEVKRSDKGNVYIFVTNNGAETVASPRYRFYRKRAGDNGQLEPGEVMLFSIFEPGVTKVLKYRMSEEYDDFMLVSDNNPDIRQTNLEKDPDSVFLDKIEAVWDKADNSYYLKLNTDNPAGSLIDLSYMVVLYKDGEIIEPDGLMDIEDAALSEKGLPNSINSELEFHQSIIENTVPSERGPLILLDPEIEYNWTINPYYTLTEFTDVREDGVLGKVEYYTGNAEFDSCELYLQGGLIAKVK